MRCATNKMKHFVFFINGVFAIGGSWLIALGVLQNHILHHELKLSWVSAIKLIEESSIVLWVVGAVLFLVALGGCYGAVQENKCVLYTYSSLMTILLIVQCCLAVEIIEREELMLLMVKNEMRHDNCHTFPEMQFCQVWDDMQINMRCCGVNSDDDWGTRIPTACRPHYFRQGCGDKIFGFTNYGMYSTIVFAFLELLGVGFGAALGMRFNYEGIGYQD